jgi:hypothetical protein
VCYYAKNYGQESAFTPWQYFTGSDGYCKNFTIPTRNEVRNYRPPVSP